MRKKSFFWVFVRFVIKQLIMMSVFSYSCRCKFVPSCFPFLIKYFVMRKQRVCDEHAYGQH